MGKEIERKFLIKDALPFKLSSPKLIKQGYVFAEEGKHLRIRLIGDSAIIGLKYTEKLVRDEFEYVIPYHDGVMIYEKCDFKLEKIRFGIQYLTSYFELDVFPNGVQFVEIEFKSEEESKDFVVPEWLGEEITGNPEYSNIKLAKLNLRF